MRFLLPLALLATPAAAQDAAPPAAAPLAAADAALDRNYDAFVEELVTLTQIPAPPFKEAARAAAVADRFRAIGFKDVTTDKMGNVLALRPGTDPKAKAVVVSAHLDTVFPEGTNVTVRREGTKLHAPGVGDDTRGLATLLAWARALDTARVRTRAPILFVATVGEEGLATRAARASSSTTARGRGGSPRSSRSMAPMRHGSSIAGWAQSATMSSSPDPAGTATARSDW